LTAEVLDAEQQLGELQADIAKKEADRAKALKRAGGAAAQTDKDKQRAARQKQREQEELKELEEKLYVCSADDSA